MKSLCYVDSFVNAPQIRGAPAIASLAALSLAFHLSDSLVANPSPDFLASPEALKTHVEGILSFLSTARPTAVNLGAATRRLGNDLHASFTSGADTRAIAEKLIATGKLIADEDIGRNKEMSMLGGDWLLNRVGNNEGGLNVLTVCNTGSLATSVCTCEFSHLFILNSSMIGIWYRIRLNHVPSRVWQAEQSLLHSDSALPSRIKVSPAVTMENFC